MKILVVDDMISMRKVTSHILGSLGYSDVSQAENGHKALQKLENSDFDFVITDWNMPGMTGLELLRSIRANQALAKIPVLMLTAESSRGQVIDAAKAGVNSYIMKPFTAEMLKKKIAFIFDRKQ